MKNELRILIDFAEGKLSSKDFEQEIYTNQKLEELLSTQTVDWYGTYFNDSSPFLYLVEQNYNSPSGRLNAQAAVKLFLDKVNIQVKPTNKYSEEYDLLLTSTPKYIDVEPTFFEKYIMPTDESLSIIEKRQVIKRNFDLLFKYHKKPPKWIQNPNWLVKNDKPMYFLGQVDIVNCNLFHDNGSVYLFVDTDTGDIETVKQFY